MLTNKRTHEDRMKIFSKAGLYLVTSETLSAGRQTIEIVEKALEGGVKLIQLREKHKNQKEILELGKKVKELTDKKGALLLLNDFVDIAVELDCDGVHLGQDDEDPKLARQKMAEGIIGVSAHDVEEVLLAKELGASYYNIGPIFSTKTKVWNDDFLGVDAIPELSAHSDLPFTVMGGIKSDNIESVLQKKAKTIALVTEVTKAEDVSARCASLLKIIKG